MLVVLQLLGKVWVFVAFKINQDYIAQNFCEKRFEPAAMCSGKCVLEKMLGKQEEQEQKLIDFLKKESETNYIVGVYNLLSFLHQGITIQYTQKISYHKHWILRYIINSLFQPPEYYSFSW
jgi:hypothetical protein